MEQEPVTVLITRRAKKGREPEIKKLMREIFDAALAFEGQQGARYFFPETPNSSDFAVIFRFDTKENLGAWLGSPERKSFYEQLKPLVEEESLRKIYGLESLFISTPDSPPKWKMVIILICVIYPLVILLSIFYSWLLGDNIHFTIRALCSLATSVLLTTYAILPFVTRMLRNWLNKA
jgi:antibiotic biosynthesis monooxygenase (ABM) superfamily enzyme